MRVEVRHELAFSILLLLHPLQISGDHWQAIHLGSTNLKRLVFLVALYECTMSKLQNFQNLFSAPRKLDYLSGVYIWHILAADLDNDLPPSFLDEDSVRMTPSGSRMMDLLLWPRVCPQTGGVLAPPQETLRRSPPRASSPRWHSLRPEVLGRYPD
ncbi:hypothetical protein C8R46DRAFT_1121061 [Mycena filopes]|nr:hypothetical protein C8R46DRAFT_1121061 [Mycena filopes]